MKSILAACALAGGLAFSALPSAAAPFNTPEAGMSSPGYELAQYSEGRCRRLRRQCEMKDVRGERGEGNCRRYRRECSRWWR